MHRRVLSLLLLFVLTAAASAQYGAASQPGVKLRSKSFADLYAAQRVLLSSYCRLDFEGARLQPTGWNRLKPFTSLRTNPEFTRVIIVTRFAIETPEQPTEQLDATYQTVGFYEDGEGYTASSLNDRVTFRMQEQNGDLVVTNLSPETPHVSPQAAIVWMNLRLSDPNTSELERAHLKDAMNQLNKLLPQPHPVTTIPGA
jgi:hypothetical protein